MLSNQVLMYIMGGTVGVLAVMVVAYFLIQKVLNKSDVRRIRQLTQGTKEKKYSSEIIYQKLYVFYKEIPFLKRYVLKLRRKLEIINIDDEYLTRKQTAKIMTNATIAFFLLTIAVLIFTAGNPLLCVILLLFEIFLIEAIMSGMVDKLDTKLLKQQVDFFAEIRHAYHEYNMVEEAIYEVSQNDELEVSRQGSKVYEILISDDPEMELEKYYDVAPNAYLKEFAGISYLTREFGDRTINRSITIFKKLKQYNRRNAVRNFKKRKTRLCISKFIIYSCCTSFTIATIKRMGDR